MRRTSASRRGDTYTSRPLENYEPSPDTLPRLCNPRPPRERTIFLLFPFSRRTRQRRCPKESRDLRARVFLGILGSATREPRMARRTSINSRPLASLFSRDRSIIPRKEFPSVRGQLETRSHAINRERLLLYLRLLDAAKTSENSAS